ncbi:MAG: hypothetical protein IIC97_04270 [Chloroflexi bacterium]|nr:hypothetical protein [Chloroflexota bacterium]
MAAIVCASITSHELQVCGSPFARPGTFPAVENDILGDNYAKQQEKSAGRQLNADGMVEHVGDQISKRRRLARDIVPQAGDRERCPEPIRYEESELDANRTEADDHTKQSDSNKAVHDDSADSVGLKFEKANISPLNTPLILKARASVTSVRNLGRVACRRPKTFPVRLESFRVAGIAQGRWIAQGREAGPPVIRRARAGAAILNSSEMGRSAAVSDKN